LIFEKKATAQEELDNLREHVIDPYNFCIRKVVGFIFEME
jgi:hypothetical protein